MLSVACNNCKGMSTAFCDEGYVHDLKRLLKEKLSLLDNGTLHRICPQGRSQIVVPTSLVPEVLQLAHDHVSSTTQEKWIESWIGSCGLM